MRREARFVKPGTTVLVGGNLRLVSKIFESRNGDVAFLTDRGSCFWSGRLDDKVEVYERD